MSTSKKRSKLFNQIRSEFEKERHNHWKLLVGASSGPEVDMSTAPKEPRKKASGHTKKAIYVSKRRNGMIDDGDDGVALIGGEPSATARPKTKVTFDADGKKIKVSETDGEADEAELIEVIDDVDDEVENYSWDDDKDD